MFNLASHVVERVCCSLSSKLMVAFTVILTRSAAQVDAPPENATYWDAVYSQSQAAGVQNFSRAWQGVDWPSLNAILDFKLRPEDRVLVLGAGDSSLAQEIFDTGCWNVTAVDFSAVIVSAMGELSHGVIWRVEDASHLSFPDSSFDVVLELGLLDTVGTGGEYRMLNVVSEAHRVLVPGGVYVSSSTEPPLFRLPLFENSFDGNATKVLFLPRPRELDQRVRRIDVALDLGKLSVYVSRKIDVLIADKAVAELDGAGPSGTQESEHEQPPTSDMAAQGAKTVSAEDFRAEEAITAETKQDPTTTPTDDVSELAANPEEIQTAVGRVGPSEIST